MLRHGPDRGTLDPGGISRLHRLAQATLAQSLHRLGSRGGRLDANAADKPNAGQLLQCHIRSDTTARDILYHYDALLRFADGQHGGDEGQRRAADARHYIELQALGIALTSRRRRVVLIDEIDKAPRDLPNDLLRELERGEFEIPEIPRQLPAGEPVHNPSSAAERVPLTRIMTRPQDALMPVVIITSNVERQLPDPFLRRCVFYNIPFPDHARLLKIVHTRFPEGDDTMLEQMVDIFTHARDIPELVKPPSTAELLSWVGALTRTFVVGDVRNAINAFHQRRGERGALRGGNLRWDQLPGVSCLIKMREDLDTAHRCLTPAT